MESASRSVPRTTFAQCVSRRAKQNGTGQLKAASIIPSSKDGILASGAVSSDITRHGIRYYDEHTLYIMYGACTIHQLKDSLMNAIRQASIILQKKTSKDPIINMVTTADGKSLGYGYVWIPDPQVYFLLAGMNADGTERVEYIDDPDWKAPEAPLDPFPSIEWDDSVIRSSSESSFDLSNKPLRTSSWADLAMEEDGYNCPKIKRKLPPLVSLPPFKHSPEQLKELSTSKGAPAAEGSFDVTRADVGEVEDREHHNILCSRSPIPKWIDVADLKRIFQPYVTDTSAKYRRHARVPEQDTYESYPVVTINKNRTAYITFNPSSRDAQFAILMTKKITVEKDEQQQVLLFAKYLRRD